jgi:hypothetical protein
MRCTLNHRTHQVHKGQQVLRERKVFKVKLVLKAQQARMEPMESMVKTVSKDHRVYKVRWDHKDLLD